MVALRRDSGYFEQSKPLLSHSPLIERRPAHASHVRATRSFVGSRCESDEPDA
jgi:hypothetical protein